MPVPFAAVRTVPIPKGDEGTVKTVQYMARMIREGSKDPSIRQTAISIVLHWPNDVEKVDALYRFVQSRMSYVRDCAYSEALMTANGHVRQFLQAGQSAGDCDDHVIFLGSLIASIGYPIRIVVIRGKPGDGPFDHVYLETLLRGTWVSLDATAKNKPLGWRVPNPSRIRKYNV